MAAADASAAGPPSLCHGLPVFQKKPAPWTMPPYRRHICQRSKSFRQARPKASVMRAPRNILLLMAFCWLYLLLSAQRRRRKIGNSLQGQRPHRQSRPNGRQPQPNHRQRNFITSVHTATIWPILIWQPGILHCKPSSLSESTRRKCGSKQSRYGSMRSTSSVRLIEHDDDRGGGATDPMTQSARAKTASRG